jgi:hypothetical protein
LSTDVVKKGKEIAELSSGSSANGVSVSADLEFGKDAIVARYGKDGMTFFTGKFTESGEGIFSKCPNKE